MILPNVAFALGYPQPAKNISRLPVIFTVESQLETSNWENEYQFSNVGARSRATSGLKLISVTPADNANIRRAGWGTRRVVYGAPGERKMPLKFLENPRARNTHCTAHNFRKGKWKFLTETEFQMRIRNSGGNLIFKPREGNWIKN